MTAKPAVDVIVVGSGAAGLTAALAVAKTGASVLVLEVAPVFGGTSAISGGVMWLPGNPFAKALGVEESSSEVETYLRRLTLGLVREEVLQSFIEWAPKVSLFLSRETRLKFEAVNTPDYQSEYPGAAVGRSVSPGLYDTNRLGEHQPFLRALTPGASIPLVFSEQTHGGFGFGSADSARGLVEIVEERNRSGIAARGRALIGALLEACIASGVALVANARALSLVESGGRVVGVNVLRDGKTERFRSRSAVVLASGGFEWNQSLWNGLTGKPLECPLSPPYNRGDALCMASLSGARLEHTSMAWWMPAIMVEGEQVDGKPSGRLFPIPKGLPGAIAVNRYGRRFGNEAMNYNDFGLTMTAFDPHEYEFPNLPAWVVMDNAHYESYGIGSLAEGLGDHWLTTAPSLGALAEKVGVDPAGLTQEVAEFNKYAVDGIDVKFKRGQSAHDAYRSDPQHRSVRPVEGGPFHAYRQYLGCLGTKGGPAVDGKARVIGHDQRPIAGLHAVGNAAATPFGPSYPGAGSTLGAGVALAYAAANSLSEG